MRQRFDDELKLLNEEMLIMSMHVEQAIEKAVNLIFKRNDELAKEVYDYEEEIDRLEYKIQNHCLRLLVEQQPVASDLRMISSSLKIITDLERIGDQARDIAEITMHFEEDFHIESLESIKKMAKATIRMVRKAIDSHVKRDLETAKQLDEDDDVVDQYFVKVRDDLIEAIKNDTMRADYIADLIMITKYLERIADHSVNIAEWVIFAIEG